MSSAPTESIQLISVEQIFEVSIYILKVIISKEVWLILTWTECHSTAKDATQTGVLKDHGDKLTARQTAVIPSIRTSECSRRGTCPAPVHLLNSDKLMRTVWGIMLEAVNISSEMTNRTLTVLVFNVLSKARRSKCHRESRAQWVPEKRECQFVQQCSLIFT